jgi:hypothetical protein
MSDPKARSLSPARSILQWAWTPVATVIAASSMAVAAQRKESFGAVLGASAVIWLPARHLVAILLAAGWPALQLGPTRAGLALAAIGVVIALKLATMDHGVVGVSRLPSGFVTIATCVMALTVTNAWLAGTLEAYQTRILAGILVSVPMFAAGVLMPWSRLRILVICWWAPGLLLSYISPNTINMNPITFSVLNAVTVVICGTTLLKAKNSRPQQVLLCILFGLSLFEVVALSVSLGPKFALAGTAAIMALRTYSDGPRRASPLLARVGLLGLALLFLSRIAAQTRAEISSGDALQNANSAVRLESLRVSLDSFSPVGAGLGAFDDVTGISGTHNVFGDAALAAGVLGLLFVAWIFVHVFRSLWGAATTQIEPIIWLLAALTSGGFAENWLFWFAAGHFVAVGQQLRVRHREVHAIN